MTPDEISHLKEQLFIEINHQQDRQGLMYQLNSVVDDGAEKVILNIMNLEGNCKTKDFIIVSLKSFRKHFTSLALNGKN